MTEHHRSAAWKKVVAVIRPRINAQLPLPCIDCGRLIMPGDKWQVGHIVSVMEATAQGWSVSMMNSPQNLGPSHAKAPGQKACNQIAGGKMGAAKTNAKRKEDKRLPQW